MATAAPCPFQTSQTDIHFFSPDRIIPLKHKHDAHYRQRDHLFHFQVVQEGGNIGKFRPNALDRNGQKVHLDKAGEVDIRDLVLVTEMTSQALEEELNEQGDGAPQRGVEIGISV